jgi:hypothetical protein
MSDNTRSLLAAKTGRKSSVTQKKKEDLNKKKLSKKLNVSQSNKGLPFYIQRVYPDSVRKMLTGQFDILVSNYKVVNKSYCAKNPF